MRSSEMSDSASSRVYTASARQRSSLSRFLGSSPRRVFRVHGFAASKPSVTASFVAVESTR